MFALATVFFFIRMVVKYLRYTPWGADDTLLVVAYVRLQRCSFATYDTRSNLGRCDLTMATDLPDPFHCPHPMQ